MSKDMKLDGVLETERVLPDDYPIYAGYLYVADGRVYQSDYHGVSVKYLKAKEGFKEVRRCDMDARGFFS
jgi:hypothetical protein